MVKTSMNLYVFCKKTGHGGPSARAFQLFPIASQSTNTLGLKCNHFGVGVFLLATRESKTLQRPPHTSLLTPLLRWQGCRRCCASNRGGCRNQPSSEAQSKTPAVTCVRLVPQTTEGGSKLSCGNVLYQKKGNPPRSSSSSREHVPAREPGSAC